jgi:hypothetical protein
LVRTAVAQGVEVVADAEDADAAAGHLDDSPFPGTELAEAGDDDSHLKLTLT